MLLPIMRRNGLSELRPNIRGTVRTKSMSESHIELVSKVDLWLNPFVPIITDTLAVGTNWNNGFFAIDVTVVLEDQDDSDDVVSII